MLGQSLFVVLLAATPAADPGDDSPARPAHELRAAVHETLRRHATAEGARQDQALRDLAALYHEVAESQAFSERSQRELRTLVRGRLLRAQTELERELKAAAPAETPPAQPAAVSPIPRAVLAQVPGNLPVPPANAQAPQANRNPALAAAAAGNQGSPFAAATERNAQQLVDLIQETIKPASWDVNGGLGTIRYFAPKQVLVIRQTDDIHGQIGGAIQNLRGQK